MQAQPWVYLPPGIDVKDAMERLKHGQRAVRVHSWFQN